MRNFYVILAATVVSLPAFADDDVMSIYTDSVGIMYDDKVSIDTLSAEVISADTAIHATISTDSVEIIYDDTISPPHNLVGIPEIFYLHPKRAVKSIDSLIAPSLAQLSLSSPTSPHTPDQSDLSISGYKSFGVSIGELGEVNIEQGLEVTIEGEIRPGTTLGAYLSDQGSSLDGSTREISDFDAMNVTLENKKFTVTAGDLFLGWPAGGILTGQKKAVGLAGEIRPNQLSVDAFGSFSGGNSAVQTMRGREGVQGPYYLTGRGEAAIITPVAGTVAVRVNGRELTEGYDEDYTVDYDIGAVSFNPRVLIRSEDFIRVEYEYKVFDYRRTFAGGGASYHSKDSAFTIRGRIWSESDDKDNPIEMQLTGREKDILKNSGGDPVLAAPTARPVHPLDAAKMSVYHPLYKKRYDDGAKDTILVYTPYDPLRPNDTRDFYTAVFSPVSSGSEGADYIIDTSIDRGQLVYVYAGAGMGDHTALAPISAPKRETAGEVEARLNLPYIRSSLNIAGKELNKNLFSESDDSRELSSAAIFKLGVGERHLDKRTIWGDVDYRYRSRLFTSEALSASERKEKWDVEGGGGNSQNMGDKQNENDKQGGGGLYHQQTLRTLPTGANISRGRRRQAARRRVGSRSAAGGGKVLSTRSKRRKKSMPTRV